MLALRERHPQDSLVAELARCLPSRHVATARLQEWLEPLRAVFELQPVGVLREADGTPIAWKVEGTRRG